MPVELMTVNVLTESVTSVSGRCMWNFNDYYAVGVGLSWGHWVWDLQSTIFLSRQSAVLLSNIQSSESILQIDLSMRVLHVSFSSFKVLYFVITKLVLFRSRSRTELDHLYFFSNKWSRIYRWNAAFNASIINICFGQT